MVFLESANIRVKWAWSFYSVLNWLKISAAKCIVKGFSQTSLTFSNSLELRDLGKILYVG